MARKIAESIYLIHECNGRPNLEERYETEEPDWYVGGESVNTCQNAYLLLGEETLLFDTLSPANTEHVLSELEAVLDGRELDYLVVSHPEAPHAGNALAILDEHPEARLIAPDYGTEHDLYHLGSADVMGVGDGIDLGDLHVEFVEPEFVDHRIHLWMYEHTTETLFTVDWLGTVHMGSECRQFVDELAQPVTTHRLAAFHNKALFWFEYADLGRVEAAIERIIADHAPSMLAPAHGFVVREDTDEYMRKMNDVVATIRGADSIDGDDW